MKKLILTAIVAVSVSFSAFSQTSDVDNQNAENNFEANFSQALNVGWISKDNFTKAVFSQDGRDFQAYYNLEGDWFATTTYLDMDDVPTAVKNVLAKKYGNYKIESALQVEAEDQTAYLFVAEDDIETVVVKVEDRSLTVVSKVAKIKS